MENRLILLGGARRVTLAEQFKSVHAPIGELALFSFERDQAFYPISAHARVVAAPRFADPAFDAALTDFLIDHRALVVGCMDAAIPAIARLRERDFGGGRIVGHSEEGAAISLNKALTHDFCRRLGIPHPRRFPAEVDAGVRLIAKPIEGFGGKGISVLEPGCDERARTLAADHIVQELLAGTETTHDLYVDRDGGVVSCSRDRLAVIDGEVDHCIVRESAADEAAIFRAIAASGLFWGPVTVQTFRTPANEVVLIEINARLGGGVTASIAAGFPVLELFFEESLGVSLPRRQFSSLEMKRARRDFYRFLS
jgi:carbamoyl-phosphate synthase large subunit